MLAAATAGGSLVVCHDCLHLRESLKGRGLSDHAFCIQVGSFLRRRTASELFGHEKGAFTGAERRRIGKFEQVSGGTLFLDEVGDMPLAAQAKLLRGLQEQAFERLGGSEIICTDVRLIAATHRDVRQWSDDGKFRPDLYYRLGVFTINLPPLRERGDDLALLVRFSVRQISRELGRVVAEVAAHQILAGRADHVPLDVVRDPVSKPERQRAGPRAAGEHGHEGVARTDGRRQVADEGLKELLAGVARGPSTMARRAASSSVDGVSEIVGVLFR